MHVGQLNLMEPNAKKHFLRSEDGFLTCLPAKCVRAYMRLWACQTAACPSVSLSGASDFSSSNPFASSGPQFSPGGSGAASSLPGRQKAQGSIHRQQVSPMRFIIPAVLRNDVQNSSTSTAAPWQPDVICTHST